MLMLVHALRESASGDRERLGRILSVSRDARTQSDVDWLFELFSRGGRIDFGRASLRDLVAGALLEFDAAYRDARPSAELDFLHAVIPYFGDREV